MARLSLDEIKVGLVAHLDQTALSKDPGITDTCPQQFTELRPFVCVAINSPNSTWAPLTSTPRPERVEIKDEWREGGLDMWRDRVCYLNDGANVYIGRTGIFIGASAQDKTVRNARSRMKQEGVDAVLAEMEKQRGRRVNGHDL